MLLKVLPSDQKKLQRITLEKTIPRLIKLTKELETMQISLPANDKKLKKIEARAQLYMRELLLSKLITDFRIQHQVSTGLRSSCQIRQLTHELLPFAIQLHSMIPEELALALCHLITKITNKYHDWHILKGDAKDKALNLCGFIKIHVHSQPIINHYSKLLGQQLQIHQTTLLRDRRPKMPKTLTDKHSKRSRQAGKNGEHGAQESKLKSKRNAKRLRK